MSLLDVLAELFTWVGFGIGALLAGVAVVAYLFDGTWMRVDAMLEREDGELVARWFASDGGVGRAVLHPHDAERLGDAAHAELFAREGSHHRVRLSGRSPLVSALGWFAAVFLALGVVAVAASMVLLFAGV
ncbi:MULTISPECIES: hypothetical protein [Microbacterium]|jgi:hypothetical protein|uniref:hypothetical protein n=1 Tax=Microbacterium TaxID=33882 RepID=UPI0010F641E7|nr:hypothetical protein [Microbacterium sp. 4NA327F11]MCK9915353.1 hypothetical protein [Microbacteriaceae bacterium K1510]